MKVRRLLLPLLAVGGLVADAPVEAQTTLRAVMHLEIE